VAGQRRLAAARELGLVRVPVMLLNEIRPDYLVDSLLENIQREELSGIDEGHSFITLKEEFGWSQREIANRIHKHESYVSERIRTAEKLTAITKEIISEAFAANENLARAKFSHSINRKLALLRAEEQEALARLVASTPDITARKVEGLVREKLLPYTTSHTPLTPKLAEVLPEQSEPPTGKDPKKPARSGPGKAAKPAEANPRQPALAGGVLPAQPSPQEGTGPLNRKSPRQASLRLSLSYNPANLDPAMTRTLDFIRQQAASNKRLDLEELIEVIKEDCRQLKPAE
jgi:ParB/RepB/Spo0J family partition protein